MEAAVADIKAAVVEVADLAEDAVINLTCLNDFTPTPIGRPTVATLLKVEDEDSTAEADAVIKDNAMDTTVADVDGTAEDGIPITPMAIPVAGKSTTTIKAARTNKTLISTKTMRNSPTNSNPTQNNQTNHKTINIGWTNIGFEIRTPSRQQQQKQKL